MLFTYQQTRDKIMSVNSVIQQYVVTDVNSGYDAFEKLNEELFNNFVLVKWNEEKTIGTAHGGVQYICSKINEGIWLILACQPIVY